MFLWLWMHSRTAPVLLLTVLINSCRGRGGGRGRGGELPGRERGGAVTRGRFGVPEGKPQLLHVVELQVHHDVQGCLRIDTAGQTQLCVGKRARHCCRGGRA